MKRLTLLLCIFFITLSVSGQSTYIQDSRRVTYTDCKVPYKLKALFAYEDLGDMFIFLEDKYYNQTNLTTSFTCLSKKYPEFLRFQIFAFNNEQNLRIAIRNAITPIQIIDNPPQDTQESDCANLEKAVRPCKIGYYWADYFRSGGDNEQIHFTINIKNGMFKRIFLKRPK